MSGDSDVLENLQKARRRKNSSVVVKDDGTSALVDRKNLAKQVCMNVKERLREDMHTLFQNYLLKHVPLDLAKELKHAGFTKASGDAWLPHELIVIWKEVAAQGNTAGIEKQQKLAEIENAFKDYLKKYVETIVSTIEEKARTE